MKRKHCTGHTKTHPHARFCLWIAILRSLTYKNSKLIGQNNTSFNCHKYNMRETKLRSMILSGISWKRQQCKWYVENQPKLCKVTYLVNDIISWFLNEFVCYLEANSLTYSKFLMLSFSESKTLAHFLFVILSWGFH